MRIRTMVGLGTFVLGASAACLASCTGGAVNPTPEGDASVHDATSSDVLVQDVATIDGATPPDDAAPDAAVDDAAVDDVSVPDTAPAIDASDAAAPDAADVLAPRYCDLGLAHGDPTGGTISLFDAEGNPIPSGHYRITYVDGCMTYGGGQAFTVHAYPPSTADAGAYATWMLVDSTGAFQPAALPGFWIYGADAAAAPADYDSCVTLNRTAPALEIDYDAGVPLAVQIDDSPLGDNTFGPDGGVPTWRLEHYSASGACP